MKKPKTKKPQTKENVPFIPVWGPHNADNQKAKESIEKVKKELNTNSDDKS